MLKKCKQALLVCFSGYFHKVRRCKSHFTDPLLQNLIQARQVTVSGFLLDVIQGLTLNNAWRIIRSRQQHSVIEACRLADGSHYKKIPLWRPFLPSLFQNPKRSAQMLDYVHTTHPEWAWRGCDELILGVSSMPSIQRQIRTRL